MVKLYKFKQKKKNKFKKGEVIEKNVTDRSLTDIVEESEQMDVSK